MAKAKAKGKPSEQIRIPPAPRSAVAAPGPAAGAASWEKTGCRKCGEQIGFSSAKHAEMPGICGKCIDRFRRGLRKDLEREVRDEESRRMRVVHFVPRRSAMRVGVLAGLLGFTAAVVLALVQPEWFEAVLDHTRAGAFWVRDGAQDLVRRLVS